MEMEIAAVHAIAELAQAEQSEVVAAAYAGATLSFGPEYLIPKPFDPRLMMKIAPAVAQGGGRIGRRAAPDRRPGRLSRKAADLRLRVGHDDEADLHARQARASTSASPTPKARRSACCARCRSWSTRALARPTLIGRPDVIAQRIEKFGLRLKAGRDYDLVNTEHDHRYRDYLADLPPHDRAQGRDRAASRRSRCGAA